MEKSYYDILGVNKNASQSDIKSAYRKLSKQYHPDVNKSPDAEEKFKEINEAYGILSDEEKKSQYDRFGTVGDNGGDWEAGDPFSGFNPFGGFGNFGGFSGGFGRRTKQQEQGEDVRINVNITMEDMLFGAKKKMRMKKDVTCKYCHGSGSESNDTCQCPVCNGTGWVQKRVNIHGGMSITMAPCQECGGTGTKIKDPCKHCGGRGVVNDYTEVEIEIPKGMPGGAYFVVPGKGGAGPHRGVPGNLIVMCNELPNEKGLKREDNDLLYTVVIPFKDMVFGADVEVPYIKGTQKIHLDKGTPSGKVIKMTRKGFDDPNTGDKGDYIITVECKIPKESELTGKQREAIKTL